MKKIVVAIDGPAGAGKSSTAKLVAQKLGYLFIDTGAMYRAITLKVLQNNIAESETERIARLMETTSVELIYDGGELQILLDGKNVNTEIRSPEVTAAVSAVSAIETVRAKMVAEQQRLGKNGGVVLEGRDIGTVVYPNAELKIFMIASVDERAKRRKLELQKAGIEVSEQELAELILTRDAKDSGRKISPLTQADDAIALDTTSLNFNEQVEFIVKKAEELIGK